MKETYNNIKIFMDTEFTGLHQQTTLISLGMIAENDLEFYAEFTDYNKNKIEDWIKKNILSNLFLEKKDHNNRSGNCTTAKGTTQEIKQSLETWFKNFGGIEIWSDCLSYDWVLFNQIWGHAFLIPKHIYYIPFDISTLFKIKGINPDINREEFAEGTDFEKFAGIKMKKHNALFDAKIIKICYQKLMLM